MIRPPGPPGRVFVVGCPRSGTTLLQTMLGQHPQVFTIPETHYLEKIRGRLAGAPMAAVVSPRAARAAYASLQAAVGTRGGTGSRPPWSLRARAWERAFVRTLDVAADAAGATLWVEKSPVHLHWIPELRRVAPGCRFVHVVRDGRDVVASFHRLCLAEPDRWVPQVMGRGSAGMVATAEGRRRVLDAVVDRWNADVARSLAHLGGNGHYAVVHEQLVADPRSTLDVLCSEMGIPFDDAMLRPWEAAPRVVGHRSTSPHMQRTFGPVASTRLATFHDVLGPADRDHVTRRLIHAGVPPVGAAAPSAGHPPPRTVASRPPP